MTRRRAKSRRTVEFYAAPHGGGVAIFGDDAPASSAPGRDVPLRVTLTGAAAECLEIDRPEKWPGVETVSVRRIGGRGWRYVVQAPRATLLAMLDECESRGAQRRGGEGWDQAPGASRACRVAADALRGVLAP